MAFFSPEKLKRKKIQVDHSETSANSPEVQKRLERIEENYEQLDTILAELELKMQSDDRLRAIDQSSAADFHETFGIKQKRKWRSPKKKKKKRSSVRASSKRRSATKSANPKKPR